MARKPRRQGRPRAGDELLTRERIVRTALGLVDTYGIEALSMRRLASELDVDPMAIYHHLPGKEAVLAGIVQLVFSRLRVEAREDDDWREQVRAFARAYRDLVRAHPHLTLLLITNATAAGAPVLEANERLRRALRLSGLPDDQIGSAADVIVDYVHGFALAEGLALQDGAACAVHGGLEKGIDLIVAGIEAMVSRAKDRTRLS